MPLLTSRSFKVEALCDFSKVAEHSQKVSQSSHSTSTNNSSDIESESKIKQPSETKEGRILHHQEKEKSENLSTSSTGEEKETSWTGKTKSESAHTKVEVDGKTDTCSTSKLPVTSRKEGILTNSKKLQSAAHIANRQICKIRVENSFSLKKTRLLRDRSWKEEELDSWIWLLKHGSPY